MRVVHLSKTALAGSPYEIVKCLNKYSDIETRWIALKTWYQDGRTFPQDVVWKDTDAECYKLINSSDIIHMHNDIFPLPQGMLRNKKVLVQLHSIPFRPGGVQLRNQYQHCYTILQPMQEQQYKLPGLPNLIDPEEYIPIEKTWSKPRIIFAPTNNMKVTMMGSKGKDEVIAILEKFKDTCDIIIYNNMEYTHNLRKKQSCDIIIDDIITPTFHRTSLEGSCFGLAVITGCDLGGWTTATLHTLEQILTKLTTDIALLREQQARSRAWVEEHWHPKNLVNMYKNAYIKVLCK